VGGGTGWEVTIAAPDRPGLLTSFTSAIGKCEHDLDIKVRAPARRGYPGTSNPLQLPPVLSHPLPVVYVWCACGVTLVCLWCTRGVPGEQEAHVFSSSDGYALQVFVVTSPNVHEEVRECLWRGLWV